jgi:hypothetical protein
MTPESWNSSLLGNGLVSIPTEVNTCNNRREVFSMVHTMCIATQLCGKHISAAVNQNATVEEAVFTVGSPHAYITRISTQLELELSQVLELAVAAEN